MSNKTGEWCQLNQPNSAEQSWACLAPFGTTRGEIALLDDSVSLPDSDHRIEAGNRLLMSVSNECIAAFGRGKRAATFTQVFSLGNGLSFLLIRLQCALHQAALLACLADPQFVRFLQASRREGRLAIGLRNEGPENEVSLNVPISREKSEVVLVIANRMPRVDRTALASELGGAAQWAHDKAHESLTPSVASVEAMLSVVLPDNLSINAGRGMSRH